MRIFLPLWSLLMSLIAINPRTEAQQRQPVVYSSKMPTIEPTTYGKIPRQRRIERRESPYYFRRRYNSQHRETRELQSKDDENVSEESIESQKKGIRTLLSTELGVAILVGAVIVFFARRGSYDHINATEDPLQYLHGLRREDMEDAALEALKWSCAICQFHNPEDRPTCSLCDTKRGIELAVIDMNTKQKCARARKQWQRAIDDMDRPFWNEMAIPTHQSPHYIVSSTGNEHGHLKFEILSDTSANQAINGDTISNWWLTQLGDLSCQSFSMKYAWLLTQISHSYKGYSKMQVYREKIFEESLEILMLIPSNHLCTMTRIELLGESGIDAGGVLREWYSLLTISLFEFDRGLFIPANQIEKSYFINPESLAMHGEDHLRRYQAIGRMLGGAIVDGQVLPFHLSLPLFKILLGTPLSIEDIWHLDLNLYNSLLYIRDTENVQELSLDFSVTTTSHEIIDIIPNGRNISVTSDNRDEYVTRMISYLLFERIQPQIEALVKGLYEVVSPELLLPFDANEFELLVCGYSHIDVADWQASTSVSNALKSSKCLKWFWDIVADEMTDNDRAKLLRFATGSSRVPLQGFKGLTSYDGKLCPFSLKAIPYSRGIFPKAHSCFNRIDLPIYPTRELLREALTALVQLEATEFTLE